MVLSSYMQGHGAPPAPHTQPYSTGAPSIPRQDYAGLSGPMYSAAQQLSAPAIADDLRRQHEQEQRKLQEEVREARNENQRLTGIIREYEVAAQRANEELRAYREAMERREEEYQRIRVAEERRLSEVVEEYRVRFEHERKRLAQALERNNQLTRTIAGIIPEFVAVEREVQAYQPSGTSSGPGLSNLNLSALGTALPGTLPGPGATTSALGPGYAENRDRSACQ